MLRVISAAMMLTACDPRVCMAPPDDQVAYVLEHFSSPCARRAIESVCLVEAHDLGYAGLSYADGTSYIDATAPRGTIAHELAIQVIWACPYDALCASGLETTWCK